MATPATRPRSSTEKRASLCSAISGTVNKSDFERFEAEMADPVVAELLPKTASVMVSVPEAQQAVPQEMLDTADQQGVATVTNVEAQPDPMVEQPQPVQQFGMYKVWEAGTGNQIVGFVIPELLDPRTGQSVPNQLFINGGQFALQPSISGVLVAVSHNLPEGPPEPRGMGIFYKTDGKTIVATIPFNVMTKVTVEGREYYSAQTTEGLEVQITPSEGLQRPLAVSPKEIAIPQEFMWLPLNNEVQLEGGGGDVMGPAKQAAAPSMIEIRAWRNERGPGGGCDLSGPVFSKLGSGTHDWVDGIFWLAAAGMPQNLSIACLEKAASSGQPVRLYGLRALDPVDHTLKHAAAEAVAKLASIKLPQRANLLREAIAIGHDKEARALVGVDTVDNLLALNFINPENVETFVDYIPELEETASKLASLVFATQVGLQGIPKTAAIRAMNSLEDILTGLKSLKSYSL
jgi:hypothetical protein